MPCELTGQNRDLKRAGNGMEIHLCGRGQDPELTKGMINQPLHVLGIVLAGDNRESAFGPDQPGTHADLTGPWGNGSRHFGERTGVGYSMCPSFFFLVSRYLALCGLGSARIGTCS